MITVSKKEMNNNDLSYICQQLSLFMATGLPPADGLALCVPEGGAAKEGVARALDSINEGQTLGEALGSGGFPNLMCAMISVGEATGSLDSVLDSLASYYARMEEARSALASAVIYPAMIFILMLAVQGVLCARVLPIMAAAMEQSGGSISGPARVFAAVGGWISSHIVISLLLLAIPAAAAAFCLSDLDGFARVFLKNTGWRRASERANAVSAMALAMRAGADADDAVRTALPLCGDPAPLEKCLELTGKGQSLGAALEQCGILDPAHARLLDAGVQSGSGDVVMERLGRELDKAATRKLEGLLSSVEPALVTLMALMTGFILLSVMSPMAALISAV